MKRPGRETSIAIDQLPQDPEFRPLASVPGIAVDLRYAGPHNLLGQDLYSPHDCAWLHVQAAEALARAAQALSRLAPGRRLCVLDAVRPQRVQERFWAHVRGTPMQAYFAAPQVGSIHSFGMAVDVTLADAQGQELDLGTPFDDTSERSHPALEREQLDRGVLLEPAVAHRRLLREAMAAGGWRGISTEWWHFEVGDRDAIRARWRRVL
jgi:D-alanyl-D-alanine dipeptidase